MKLQIGVNIIGIPNIITLEDIPQPLTKDISLVSKTVQGPSPS